MPKSTLIKKVNLLDDLAPNRLRHIYYPRTDLSNADTPFYLYLLTEKTIDEFLTDLLPDSTDKSLFKQHYEFERAYLAPEQAFLSTIQKAESLYRHEFKILRTNYLSSHHDTTSKMTKMHSFLNNFPKHRVIFTDALSNAYITHLRNKHRAA